MHAVLLLAAMLPGQRDYKPPEFKISDEVTKFERRVRTRDALIEKVGPEILPLTKTFGDIAIDALSKCNPGTARLLCKLDFSAVKNPVGILEAIKKHGEKVAAWVVSNYDLLADPDRVEAFTRSPLDFTYDLADLDQRAAAVKAGRQPAALVLEKIPEGSGPWIVGGAIVLALVMLWKRKAMRDAP